MCLQLRRVGAAHLQPVLLWTTAQQLGESLARPLLAGETLMMPGRRQQAGETPLPTPSNLVRSSDSKIQLELFFFMGNLFYLVLQNCILGIGEPHIKA